MIPEYRRRALLRRSGHSWPIRLRLLLIVPGTWKWNRWVRNFTARLEGHASYEADITDSHALEDELPVSPADEEAKA